MKVGCGKTREVGHGSFLINLNHVLIRNGLEIIKAVYQTGNERRGK